MSNFLTDDELVELTGFTWKAKQQTALAQMSVKFQVNPRGRILVSRTVLDSAPAPRKREPNWSALKGKAAA